MKVTYYTKKGSIYTCQTGDSGPVWFKQDRRGAFQPLAGAFHLTRTQLQNLIREYPASVLDTTLCFGNALAKEFFDDARREHISDIPEGKETHIFFLLNKGEDKFVLGYSSVIERIEKTEDAPDIKIASSSPS